MSQHTYTDGSEVDFKLNRVTRHGFRTRCQVSAKLLGPVKGMQHRLRLYQLKPYSMKKRKSALSVAEVPGITLVL